MGGYESELPARNAEGDLVAAAQHIVAALGTKKILSQDEKKILVDLRTRLTAMSMVDDSKVIESPTRGVSETEEYLNLVSEKITNRVSDETMIWDMGPEDASEYLKAVDEARVLTENLENLCLNKDDEEVELLRKAHDVLQTAMARLEEEFGHIIVQHSQPFEPEHKSFRSSERGDMVGSPISLEDDPLEDSLQRESVGKNLEDYIVDLVHPDVIPDLKCIANMMFISNYDHECSQAYVNARKHALSRCLFVLEVEPLSIDDVLKMEWGSLDSQIKRWVWALKIFVRGYLASEKRLCDDIFGEFGSLSSLCFTDSSKASVMQLLSFGDAVAVSPRQPEKLFRILDMYEVLADLHPDINSLYVEDQAVRDEFCEVLRRLGDAVRANFLEFRNAIANNASVNPFAGGGTHHLTRYVMNYLRLLTDYKDTLNQILEDAEREESLSPMADSGAFGDEVNQFDSTCNATPMAFHFRSLTSALIANIDEKSKLYKDPALQHFFLMNNIYYIAQKVKHSELRDIFGDDWINAVKASCNSGHLRRGKCCPVLAAWLYSAYTNTTLGKGAGSGEATSTYDLPMLPDDSETCVDGLEKVMKDKGVNLVKINETCDVVYCYCGIRLHQLSCPQAFHVSEDGRLAGDKRVMKLEKDCLSSHKSKDNDHSTLATCSKCLHSLYSLKKGNKASGNGTKLDIRTSKMRSRDCELMGLTWLLHKDRDTYISTVTSVMRALMLNVEGADPQSCSISSNGLPLAVDSAEIDGQSSSESLQFPLHLCLFMFFLLIMSSSVLS